MQTVYSNIKLSIPRHRMSQIEKNTVLYEIEVQTREAKWHLSKKYDDFALLHQNLKNYYHDLPEFPEKSLLSIGLSFLIQDNSQQADRAAKLQAYGQALTIRHDILNSDFFKEFFQLQKNSPGLLCQIPKLLGEFSVDPMNLDFTKGVRDFYYDDQLKTFIVTTGDMNAISRINSYITNTKLPWEDEDIPETVIPVGTVECWVSLTNPYKFEKLWCKIYHAQATTLHYCKTRERLLIGLDDGTVDELKVSPRNKYVKYEQGATFKIHEERITGIYYEPLNRIMYTISQDLCLITCDMSNYFKMNTIAHNNELSTLLVDSANKRLFIGANEGHIFVYDISTKTPSLKYTIVTAQEGPIKSMTIDLVKNYLFAAGFELGLIAIFDMDKPGRQKFTKQIACLDGKERPRCLVWVPSRMEILVGQGNGTIVFWDSLKGSPMYVLRADPEEITEMQYDDSTRRLITSSKGRSIKFWEIPPFWRDAKLVDRQQQEKAIQRRVDNAIKVREITKKTALDSDEDDLKFWHKASVSSGSESEDD